MKTKFFSYIILISLFNENFNTSLGNYQKYQERSENGFRTSLFTYRNSLFFYTLS